MRSRRLAVAAVCLLAWSPAAAQHPPVTGFHDEEDWVTVADFRHVTALAAGDQDGYVGTSGGVGVISPFERRWTQTVTAGDGLPSSVVTALGFDAAGGRLWVGTLAGLALYDPFRGEVRQDPAGLGSSPVREVRPEPDRLGSRSANPAAGSRMFVRTLDGWYGIDTFTLRADRVGTGEVPPPVAGEDLSRIPFLAGEVVRGERSGRRESFEVTGATRLPDNWLVLGTWGAGAYLYDPVRLSPEPAAFGLAGPGDGPMAWSGERLWFTNAAGARASTEASAAGLGPPDRTGVASATGDLREWTYAYPGLEPGLPSDRVYDVAASGGRTLFATDAGLALHDARAGGWRRLPPLAGGAAETLAVEAAADGFWLGTRSGLGALRLGDAGHPAEAESDSAAADSLRPAGRWLQGQTVRGLAGDSSELYAATDGGLYRLAPRAPGSAEWTLERVETLGREATDVALAPDAVVAATERGIEILPRDGGEPLRILLGEGQLDDPALAVAADRANVWVATRAGVSRWDRSRRLWTDYGLADGLPDLPVRHVLIQDARHVWFSTPAGATRLDLGDPPRPR